MTFGVFVQFNKKSRQAESAPTGYVIQESGCWEWVGSRGKDGYGRIRVPGRKSPKTAHRVIYEQERGAVPDGLVLDHLCRNRGCVNPDHLQVVTNRTNTLRGVGWCAQRSASARCIRGHLFDKENTRLTREGWRRCRACQKACNAARYTKEGL